MVLKIVVLTCEDDDVLLLLGREIAEGCREAGEQPVVAKNACEACVSEAELVFLGFTSHRRFFWNYASDCVLRALRGKENGKKNGNEKEEGKESGKESEKESGKESEGVWRNKKIALFSACYGEASRAAVSDVVRAAGEAGGRVVNTLSIVAQKTRQGGWEATEVDLARASGFGERTTNNAKGTTVFKHNEKRRIKKYLK
ncbi:MAG: hypothetical protein V1817_00715 [Candidatus Micrarchaeota archaeon]